MAGLGRRTFQAGEVLTASNVMAYLQDQAVMNFAGTAARGSAIGTAVAEGMVSYLADLNQVQVYDGSTWQKVYPAAPVTGNIVQVVSINKTDIFSSTASTYTDVTGFSASITPTSASNKILVLVTALLGANTSGDAFVQLLRGSTVIPSANAIGYTDSQNIYLPNPLNASVLDSPATTSSVTYKIQGKNNAGSTWRINSRGADTGFTGTSSLTLIEVTA